MRRYTVSYVIYGTLAVGVLSLAYGAYRLNTCRFVTMPQVFIASAFSTELYALLDKVEPGDTCTYRDVTYYLSSYKDTPIAIFATGVGPEKARATTEQTLERFSVKTLIVSGTAAATDQTMPIGDTVVALEWYDPATKRSIPTRSVLLAQVATMQNVHIIRKGVSADHFVTDTREIPPDTGAIDMETFTIMDLAEEHDVPCIAFRSVSDYATGSVHEGAYEEAARRSAEAALAFIANVR